jgi:hypothetical protein
MTIIGGSIKKSKIEQKNKINNVCILQSLLDTDIDNETQSKILNTVKQELESKGGLLGSGASNESVVNQMQTNKTNVNTAFTNQTIKDCILNLDSSNNMTLVGAEVVDSTLKQSNDSFMKCMSENSATTGISTYDAKDTTYETETKAKAEGGNLVQSMGEALSGILDSFGNIFGQYAKMIIIVVVAFIVMSMCSGSIIISPIILPRK